IVPRCRIGYSISWAPCFLHRSHSFLLRCNLPVKLSSRPDALDQVSPTRVMHPPATSKIGVRVGNFKVVDGELAPLFCHRRDRVVAPLGVHEEIAAHQHLRRHEAFALHPEWVARRCLDASTILCLDLQNLVRLTNERLLHSLVALPPRGIVSSIARN